MAHTFVISVLTKDRVGIIAGVTKALYDLGGNIAAISQTVLDGYFTIIITAAFPAGLTAEQIRAGVTKSGGSGELSVSVQQRDPAPPAAPGGRSGDRFILTITGEDRPGILHRISSYLSSRGINIEDLYAYTEGERFVLIGELMIPTEQDVRQLQIDLSELWRETTVTVRLQHQNIFLATNEIDFRHAPSRG